jgi:hypothetical protein
MAVPSGRAILGCALVDGLELGGGVEMLGATAMAFFSSIVHMNVKG